MTIARTCSVALPLLVLATIGSSLAFHDSRPVNPGNPSTLEDFKAGDVNREPYQRATDMLAALQVSPGDEVADVGAGAGYCSMRLADLVGPKGTIFAEDISNAAMEWLNARVRVFNLRNVEVVRGEIDDPKLPTERLAVVLTVDTYHHFTNPATRRPAQAPRNRSRSGACGSSAGRFQRSQI